jgi:hypothetical protein
MKCGLGCHYCLNGVDDNKPEFTELSAKDWVAGLGRLQLKSGMPLSFQGGEPTKYSGLAELVKGLRDFEIDLLTNLQFNDHWFTENFSIHTFKRNNPAPYASIRVSYHPYNMDVVKLFSRVKTLQDLGYSIGVWGVDHPSCKEKMGAANVLAKILNIDFRLKEYLGWYDNKWYGTLSYPNACQGEPVGKKVLCKTTELLIAPDGGIYRCHSDLYEQRKPIGNILDENLVIEDKYRECDQFGMCNPCDVKLKTNRFQQYGHTSVDIKEL